MISLTFFFAVFNQGTFNIILESSKKYTFPGLCQTLPLFVISKFTLVYFIIFICFQVFTHIFQELFPPVPMRRTSDTPSPTERALLRHVRPLGSIKNDPLPLPFFSPKSNFIFPTLRGCLRIQSRIPFRLETGTTHWQ